MFDILKKLYGITALELLCMGERFGNGKALKTPKTSLELLESLVEKDGASISSLSKELDMNVSTAHHHLTTLKDAGYVSSSDGHYQPTWKLLTLGGLIRSNFKHHDKIRSVVDQLALDSGERAQFIVEERGQAVWITTSLGPNAIVTDIRLGLRVPLHTIAAGKAILANLPEERAKNTLDRLDLRELTDNTITEREQLLQELEGIRERGFAVNDQERIKLEMGIGVAINDATGDLLGALSITAPSERWNTEDLVEEHAHMLLEAKSELELDITYE